MTKRYFTPIAESAVAVLPKRLNHRVKFYLDGFVMVQDGGNLSIDAQQFVDGHLGNPDGILHRKNDIFRDFDKLADKGKVLGVLGNGQRPIAVGTRHEHTCDVGHTARNTDGRGDRLLIEIEMVAQLLQDILAVTISHCLWYEVANAIGVQGIAPEHLHIGRLIDEVRLMR